VAVASLIVPARDVVKATPRTRIIQPDLRGHDFVFHAGQAVFAGLAESPVRRPYSIACSPGQAARTGAIELLVQIDDHQAPDPHLERATPGTALRIEGPFGSFVLPFPLPERQLLLIAGGTGIAPLRSIMWDTIERDRDVTVSVIYSARSADEFAYWDELNALASAGRIRLASTVTRDAGPPWVGSRGRISEELITSMLEDLEARCVICGPAGLVTATTALLKKLGVQERTIQTETYAG
jgi:ferredoxin-NADP reductase